MVEKPRPFLNRENTYRLLPSRSAFVDRLVQRIREEPTSISLQFYTFEADSVGEQIIHALLEKKKQNPAVRIQVLADDSNNMFHDGRPVKGKNGARKERDYTYQRLNDLEKEGIEVSVTNYAIVVNAAHRDHKKLAVFGGSETIAPTAFIGSTNIQDLPWKDYMVEMQGNMVPVLQDDFNETFQYARTLRRVHSSRNPWEYWKKNGPSHLREDLRGSLVRNAESRGKKIPFAENDGSTGMVATDSFWAKWIFGFGAQEATHAHYHQARDAQKGDSLDVVTPYPGIIFLSHKLRKAALNGADVNLIIPVNNNHLLYNPDRTKEYGLLDAPLIGGVVHGLLTLINKKWENSLIDSGVTIYKYKGDADDAKGMVHAKYSLLTRSDGTRRSVFGSTNISRGPISGWNREIAIVSQDDSLASQFADYTKELKNDSDVIRGRRRT